MTILRRIRTAVQGLCVLAIASGALVSAARADEAAEAAEAQKKKEFYSSEVSVKWLPKQFEVPNAEAKNEGEMKAYTEKLPGTDISFDLVPIKGGTFKLGSPADEEGRKDDEGPQVAITIEPFWMGKYEITWDEYETWAFELDIQRRKAKGEAGTDWDKIADFIVRPTKPYADMSFGMGKDKSPAICMTQYAAQYYCKWLTAKTGRYYRLPTEAEWEYACRAGSTTPYSFGADGEKLGDYAVFMDNSDDKYGKIGAKKPNAWGLYDMHGNVAEWVLDQYDPATYKTWAAKAQNCPCNLDTKEYKEFPRVVRGGSWQDDPETCRSAARQASNKDWKMQDPQIPQSVWYLTDATFVGFRVVRPMRMPTEDEAKFYEPDVRVWQEYKKAQGGKL